MLAGSLGGERTGLISGCLASLFVVQSYFTQFGPQTLTGGWPQATLGSVLFLFIGISLGRLKDQRDKSIQSLRATETKLRIALKQETEISESQTNKSAASEARLETAVRLAGIGHFSFEPGVESYGDGNGYCKYCSVQHAMHFGLTPEEYQEISSDKEKQLSLIHPDDHAHFLEALHQLDLGKTQNFEFRALRKDREVRFIHQIEEPIFDKSGKMLETIGTSIDLTELRSAEARVRQSQRIEAIGTLTGGVAHDFNNLLAIILGNLELSLEVPRDAERTELIQSAINATRRGADLTKNLLSFSRRAHLEPSRQNLNKIVQRTMNWGTRVLPATIHVENSLMAGLWDVEIDPTSAENAILNILLNGRDAMPDGGKLTIETSNVRVGDEYVAERDEDIEPGRYVMLAISDTGHGIPKDKLEKIFEPFFTDKPVGLGSGLGLSMVQGFVKQSGGAIRVYSEVGVGTTFKLYFKAALYGSSKPEAVVVDPSYAPVGKASILIAEDEEEVMRILSRTLRGAGYVVTTATSGDEALNVFKTSGSFDLLLTDVVMPGELLGPALAKAARQIDPDLPCIFLSGYASEATVHGNGLRPSDIRLMKPVSRTDLLNAVAKAISKAPKNH
ncbi:PAS domain-containing hybrid sensor histidine kinase/response regulator [Loktanella sp. M215]|uniref:PAS domain-containing hybrid sensor histidine kinase/response regulator n=1 Tax=Loktanella sp. M215 TaxID=2675431 RepID=UPI001F40329B|nr:PAS domain-containing hybrid sensor histidine kinase/response regulator [Loktanella sp. M215]